MQITWDVKRILVKLYFELKTLEMTLEKDLPHTAGWVAKRRQRSGEEVLYWYYFENKKRKAKRIPKEKEQEYEKMIADLIHKEEELKNAKKQLKLLEKCLHTLHVKPELQIKNITAVETRTPQNVPFAQNRKHPTHKGDLVRSKSEVLLADMLYYHGIEYEYEKELVLNGKILHPDFTIPLPGERVLYWEHLGMLGEPSYDRNWSYKSRIYAESGISEGNGLIITRDVNGVFDELDALHKIDLYQLAKR